MKLENKMNKVFNASLLATAVAMSFGANAATILVDPANTLTLSEEGVSVGVTEAATAIIFDTVLAEAHSGTTEIVVTFGSAVDLSALAAGPSTCGAPVTGTFTCGDVIFNVGNGNFTFDAVTIDAVAGTLTYTVSLGNTITAGSSYRTTVGQGGSFAVISDAFSADFESTLAGNVVDTGTGIIATKAPQFAAVIATDTDGTIERAARLTFTNPEAAVAWASYSITYTNDLTLLAQPTLVASQSVTDTDLTNDTINVAHATDGWTASAGTIAVPAAVPATTPTTASGDIISVYATVGDLDQATFTDLITLNRTDRKSVV